MISYPHVIMACAGEIWALQEEKLRQVSAFLVRKAKGGEALAAEDMARAIPGTRQREVAQAEGQIAVIPVYGVLAQRMNMMMEFSGGTSMQMLAGAFRAALGDGNVKAIVFDHDSPGGTVAGTQELADEIYHSRGVKPIIAQVNSLSASASYWLAAASDEVVVTPGGEAGSVGAYRIHEDVTKMLEQDGIKVTIIRSGENKIRASGFEPLSQSEAEHQQSRVDQAGDAFVRSLARSRNVTLSAVRDRFGAGRMFGAEELVARGMADRIGTLEETLERFGSGLFNPVANAARVGTAARARAMETVKSKLAAGDQLSTRELEEGLRGILGLTRSEAEAAVSRSKGTTQGDPETSTEGAITKADLAALAESLDGIRQHLRI
jgi:signal peptide peptidase SppA